MWAWFHKIHCLQKQNQITTEMKLRSVSSLQFHKEQKNASLNFYINVTITSMYNTLHQLTSNTEGYTITINTITRLKLFFCFVELSQTLLKQP